MGFKTKFSDDFDLSFDCGNAAADKIKYHRINRLPVRKLSKLCTDYLRHLAGKKFAEKLKVKYIF